jgi:hypothetical protein
MPANTGTSDRALASQRSFEAMFNHVPQIDTRTPADVRAQALREGWK